MKADLTILGITVYLKHGANISLSGEYGAMLWLYGDIREQFKRWVDGESQANYGEFTVKFTQEDAAVDHLLIVWSEFIAVRTNHYLNPRG
jgi:hypothetical protein